LVVPCSVFLGMLVLRAAVLSDCAWLVIVLLLPGGWGAC
jgi:hypothetical protein